MPQLLIRDETNARRTGEIQINLPTEEISIRELIRARVEQEVAEYNRKANEYFNGLIQPDGAEVTLNGYRMKTQRKLDCDKQFQTAIQGFESNAFLIIVDDQQVESLDQVIRSNENTTVSFLKLVPLVGG